MEDKDFEQFKNVIIRFYDMQHRFAGRALAEISDEHLYQQPAPGANSIAWLTWHFNRRKDYYSGKLGHEDHVWVTQGWNQRFGNMDPVDTGTGHTPEQVAAFRPSLELLKGYEEAVHHAAVERIKRLTLPMMYEEYDLDVGRGTNPGWNIPNPMISDGMQHVGQIVYIRGMQLGPGFLGF